MNVITIRRKPIPTPLFPALLRLRKHPDRAICESHWRRAYTIVCFCSGEGLQNTPFDISFCATDGTCLSKIWSAGAPPAMTTMISKAPYVCNPLELVVMLPKSLTDATARLQNIALSAWRWPIIHCLFYILRIYYRGTWSMRLYILVCVVTN